MRWYLIHTKPREEKRARENLERQGYTVYLPLFSAEKLRRGRLHLVQEPLFPRYLFIRLGEGLDAQSWAPIRSTLGVRRLVAFGNTPAHIDDALIDHLRAREAAQGEPARRFSSGEHVRIGQGPFAGLEAVFQMPDGQERAWVLIELLGQTTRLHTPVAGLKKVE